MLGGIFKPKWQHNNARVRISVLPTLDSEGEELIQLAENDSDTGVRLEAINYLTDLPTLIKLGKRKDSVGERSRYRVLGLAGQDGRHDSLLVEVFDWLSANPKLMHSIARDSQRDVALRKLAMQQVDDEEVLFLIASKDVSREIQYQAASAIDDLDKLKKLEKTQGRSNKRLRQLLKDRVAAGQSAQERLATLDGVCNDLESLGQSGHWARDKTRHRVLTQQWKILGGEEAIPDSLEKRFHDAEREFLGRLESHEKLEAELEPRRKTFEGLLSEAGELAETLEKHPEQLTLASVDQRLELLQEQWVATEQLPAGHQQSLNQQWMERFVGLTEQRDAVADELDALEALQRACKRAERLRDSQKPLQSRQLTALQSDWVKIKRPRQMAVSVAELEQRFHQVMDSLNGRLQREATQREEALQAMQAELGQMESDLEQEKYGEAVDIHNRLTEQLKAMGELPAKEKAGIERRLRAATPLVMEFRDWRRWGTDQAREHLIETAQRLENDDSIDPEQRAKEIKALRDEWRKLAQMEPGQQRKQWKDFDSKVTAAYEPSKQHFAAQAKQRAAHLQQREGICIQLETMKEAADWDTVDWKAQYAGINELRKAWKRCGTVGHKEWKRVNQRFNEAMDALDERLQGERSHNFKARERLVEQANALPEMEDVQEAVAEAKALQSRWRITIPSRPREEQKLWKQFREPIDQVFDNLKQQRQSQRSEADGRIHQKEDACDRLELMLKMPDEEFTVAVHELDSVRKDYQRIRDVPKGVYQKLESRFNSAEHAVLSRQEQLVWQQRLTELDDLAEQSIQLKAGENNGDSHQLEGERLCLQLEIMLDIPTPTEFQQERMEYQVAQMSEAMRSRNNHQDAREQGLELLADWYRLGAMSADALTVQQGRIDAARQAIAK